MSYIIEDHEVARTIAILRQMACGKTLKVGEHTFGMANDMAIGPLMFDGSSGDHKLFAASEMTLSAFHAMLNKHNIGSVITDA